jgi:hypothetical protein
MFLYTDIFSHLLLTAHVDLHPAAHQISVMHGCYALWKASLQDISPYLANESGLSPQRCLQHICC